MRWKLFIIGFSVFLATIATGYFYSQGYLLAYGDAESHLNISKRVVHSLTPGLAQLGGIWLPLPHLMMVPFTSVDWLWRTGLAGSIVSGTMYVIGGYYLFKTLLLITKKELPSFIGFLTYAVNPNVLYMQSTAMTEIPLIAFFILSTYFMIKFLRDDSDVLSLIFAAFWGMCATLTRYDAWFLVLAESGILFLHYVRRYLRTRNVVSEPGTASRKAFEGKFLTFATLGFVGIGLWLLWDFLILSDPFYFTNSSFSAKSQQQGWLARGELPTYRNLYLSAAYYVVTSTENLSLTVTAMAVLGLLIFLGDKTVTNKYAIAILLSVPFFFYIATLYAGQSVIFIPSLTPDTFEWQLFNVRYGLVMIPFAAVFVGYLFHAFTRMNLGKAPTGRVIQGIIASVLLFQVFLYYSGEQKVIALEDGVYGLSSSLKSNQDSQDWIVKNYDGGLVLIDDFARTTSIVRSTIPMQNVIYIGNKPYWEESLEAPEKHATWIIAQKGDTVWSNLIDDEVKLARLYKYFVKAYTSPDILIFKRNPDVH